MDRAEFRQWAMIYAMQGLLANPQWAKRSGEDIVASAVKLADALLEANTIDEPLEGLQEPTK